METKILTTAEKDLNIAADILKKGGNVIFPTETVYGLGADAKNPSAVKNIFAAKGRPSDNPLIVHICDMSQLSDLVEEVPDKAKTLIEKFWPGPLTVILKKCKNVPYETTGGLETVAVRMPASEAARRLIELAQLPIAAPSANLSGKPSPTTAKHCTDDMNGRVDAIVCGDDCEVGLESTVIDMSGDIPVLLRPGRVTAEQIEALIGEIKTVTSIKEGEKPKSPGLKYKHYSPEAEVIILSGAADDVFGYIKKQARVKKVGVLIFDEFEIPDNIKAISLGSLNEPQQAAQRLFAALREMDECKVEVVYTPEIADKGIWGAVRNRLYRAAGEKIVKVPHCDTKQVLFVCTGNTCRSPMAEAIFNNIAGRDGICVRAASAGIYADGSSASENSVTVMGEMDIDIKGRKSRQVTYEMVDNADLVLTMAQSHKMALIAVFGDDAKIQTLAEFVGTSGDVTDPYGGSVEVYRDCRDLLIEILEKAIKKL